MTIILEYEKTNPWTEGPDTIYTVVEVEGLTRKERKRNPRKVLDILKEVKGTLFDDGKIILEETEEIKYY